MAGFFLCAAAPTLAQQGAGQVGGESGDDEIAVPKVLGGSFSNTESISQREAEAIHRSSDWLWDFPVITDDPEALLSATPRGITGPNECLRGKPAKLMRGLEYADMDDPDGDAGNDHGWTLIGSVRISL